MQEPPQNCSAEVLLYTLFLALSAPLLVRLKREVRGMHLISNWSGVEKTSSRPYRFGELRLRGWRGIGNLLWLFQNYRYNEYTI